MTDRADLQTLIDQWYREANATERELFTIRRYCPEGPRYGIAAVRACADQLAAWLASQGPSKGAYYE